MIVLIFLTIFLFVFISFVFAAGRFIYAAFPLIPSGILAYVIADGRDNFMVWFVVSFLAILGTLLLIKGWLNPLPAKRN